VNRINRVTRTVRIVPHPRPYLAYSHDNAHQLVSIADTLGNHIDYTLNKMGNHLTSQVTDPANNLTRTRAQVFDSLSRLAKTIGAQNQTANYGYDANDNATSVTDPLGNKTTLAYDPLNRLIKRKKPGSGLTFDISIMRPYYFVSLILYRIYRWRGL